MVWKNFYWFWIFDFVFDIWLNLPMILDIYYFILQDKENGNESGMFSPWMLYPLNSIKGTIHPWNIYFILQYSILHWRDSQRVNGTYLWLDFLLKNLGLNPILLSSTDAAVTVGTYAASWDGGTLMKSSSSKITFVPLSQNCIATALELESWIGLDPKGIWNLVFNTKGNAV